MQKEDADASSILQWEYEGLKGLDHAMPEMAASEVRQHAQLPAVMTLNWLYRNIELSSASWVPCCNTERLSLPRSSHSGHHRLLKSLAESMRCEYIPWCEHSPAVDCC